MIKLITTFVLFLFVLFSSSKKLKDESTEKIKRDREIAERIQTSFRSGNSKMLASCLSRQIALLIDSESIEMPRVSSEKAEQILKIFFQRNPPTNFQYVYQGSSKAALRYSVAKFKSKNKDYLIYILIKLNTNGKHAIDTIQCREG